ncbi:rhomboid family intramembrane serine protease [bacterium]|nr:MAG: rhomboid family intramembrane serine protease [bacterium]
MPYRYGYSRNPFFSFFQGDAVKKIVILNVIVFILELILQNTNFIYIFGLNPRLVVTRGYVWQLATYMFIHGGFWHLFLNMFVIWIFGTTLESVWGSERFVKYYFVCGLGAAALSFVFSYNSLVIGASGAGYGILLAYAVLFPYNELYIWGIFPIKAKTLVIALIVIELLSGLAGRDGIAHFAHLGGMAAGLLYLRTDYRAWRLNNIFKNLWEKFPLKIKFSADDERDDEYSEDKVDSILDKIAEKGYENLTETERRILENYSKKKKRDN